MKEETLCHWLVCGKIDGTPIEPIHYVVYKAAERKADKLYTKHGNLSSFWVEHIETIASKVYDAKLERSYI